MVFGQQCKRRPPLDQRHVSTESTHACCHPRWTSDSGVQHEANVPETP